jgi:hypothetical protein
MTAIARRRPRSIVYARSITAMLLILTWTISGASGLVLWLAPDGRGSGQLELLLGFTKGAWGDVHWYISIAATVVTAVHLAIDRKGLLAAVRLLVTGSR